MKIIALFVIATLTIFSPEDEVQPTKELSSTSVEFIETWSRRRELELDQEYFSFDNANLEKDSLSPKRLTGWDQLPPPMQQEIDRVVRKDASDLTTILRQKIEENKKAMRQLLSEWKAVRQQRDVEQTRLAEAKALSSKNPSAKLASLLGIDNRWFWLFAAIAFLGLAIVATHFRRHEFRRQLNGGRAKKLGLTKLIRWFVLLFAIVAFVAFFFGEGIYSLVISSANTDEISTKSELLAELATEKANLSEIESKYEEGLDKWKKQVAAWAKNSPSADRQVWIDVREQLNQNYTCSQLRSEIANKLSEDNEKLSNLLEQKETQVEAIGYFNTMKRIIRSALGGGLTGLVAVIAWFQLSRMRREDLKRRQTCPQCMGEGLFEDIGRDTQRCNGQFDLGDGENIECEFELATVYLKLPKLCFPTLGLPSSGKTHWLAECFSKTRQGDSTDDNITFHEVDSQGNREIAEIAAATKRGIPPEATQAGKRLLCRPVVFRLRDNDNYGKSDVLATITDYPGEVTESREHSFRRRALNADGYFFFLDPTKSADDQIDALHNFRQDVHRFNGITSGAVLRVPVALCVTKIDILDIAKNPVGDDSIASFYQELETIDSSTPSMSLENIDAKSELMQEMRELIWPGWQIEKQIQGLFGGRVRFFPMTPISIQEGASRLPLKQRSGEAINVVEPLMWLLEMNGYKVLN